MVGRCPTNHAARGEMLSSMNSWRHTGKNNYQTWLGDAAPATQHEAQCSQAKIVGDTPEEKTIKMLGGCYLNCPAYATPMAPWSFALHCAITPWLTSAMTLSL